MLWCFGALVRAVFFWCCDVLRGVLPLGLGGFGVVVVLVSG